MPHADPNSLLTLYKYRSMAEPYGRRAAEDIIRHNRIWWQSPLAFNDPFDCDPVLVFGTSDAARREYAERAVSNRLPNLNRAARGKKARELLRKSPQVRAADMRVGFREYMQESAVTCFSENGDRPLMWAHYADSHRGVCFIFQELMEPRPWIAFDVTYSKERPRIDYTQDPRAVIEQGILTKSEDWAYECEQRMMEYRRSPGYRTFPPQGLKGVIYGARISDDDRQFMDALVIGRGELELYQAEIDEHYYRVNLRPI